MAYLLKMLSDMLQKTLNHILVSTYVPNPKVKLGPTEMFHPAPVSSPDIATARNRNQFGLTDRDLGLIEMGLQTLGFPS